MRSHYFECFFLLSSFHSFNNKQHGEEKNVTIMGLKKNKIKEESKKLALKKSSNNEAFKHIQKELAAEMETEDFQSRKNDHFKSTPTKLDISIEKL